MARLITPGGSISFNFVLNFIWEWVFPWVFVQRFPIGLGRCFWQLFWFFRQLKSCQLVGNNFFLKLIQAFEITTPTTR